jgi:hypothetical protein
MVVSVGQVVIRIDRADVATPEAWLLTVTARL